MLRRGDRVRVIARSLSKADHPFRRAVGTFVHAVRYTITPNSPPLAFVRLDEPRDGVIQPLIELRHLRRE